MSEIKLRPVSDHDEAFLRKVYASSRADEMAAIGWDDLSQGAFLDMQFSVRQRAYAMQNPMAESSVILFDGVPAGRIIVERLDSGISLTDIAVLTEFRGRGIASELIRGLQDEAAAAEKPLTLHVDRSNPGAFRLYERLGFIVISETQMNFEMRWTLPAK
jgi:ribosomal protein S18 acetylase RimI-like enzyme